MNVDSLAAAMPVAVVRGDALDWSGIPGRAMATGFLIIGGVLLFALFSLYLGYTSRFYGKNADDLPREHFDRTFYVMLGLAGLILVLIWLGDASSTRLRWIMAVSVAVVVGMTVDAGSRTHHAMYEKERSRLALTPADMAGETVDPQEPMPVHLNSRRVRG